MSVVSKLNRVSVLIFQRSPTLKVEKVGIYGFSDASFQNNPDNSTQGGQCIFVGPDTKNFMSILVNPIWFQSKKVRRKVRSTFAAELLSMEDLPNYIV